MENDWDHVTVLRKKPAGGAKTIRTDGQLNQARRAGAAIESDKKYHGGKNLGHKTDLNSAKLDRETEELSHKTVSVDVSKAIQKGRQEKQLTQKDLAVKINEKPQIIAEYEQGKALPNQQVLAKMERVLGIKLRGKEIGQPLAPKK